MSLKRESALYPPLVAYLARKGHWVRTEAPPRPGSPRRFDIVALHSRTGHVVIVEAKLRKFAQAIRQAQRGLFLAENVYVSFPAAYADYIVKNYRETLDASGIGVLGVGKRVHEFIRPRKSGIVNADRRKLLMQTVGLWPRSK